MEWLYITLLSQFRNRTADRISGAVVDGYHCILRRKKILIRILSRFYFFFVNLYKYAQISVPYMAGRNAGKNGWNALFWCNHDQPRIVSRLGNEKKYWEESSGSKRKFWNAEA